MATTTPPSYLSNTKAAYPFDFVVATTQASINSAVKTFLSRRRHEEEEKETVKVVFLADDENNPVLGSYEDLVKATNVDPFEVPAFAKFGSSNDLDKLFQARFKGGIRFRLGIPDVPYQELQKLPNIVTLQRSVASVKFSLLCSELTVCYLDPPSGYSTKGTWKIESQPTETVDDLWIFDSQVDLRREMIQEAHYSQLPPDVKTRIDQLGGQAFSVQQLLFDLSNASLMTVPKLPSTLNNTTASRLLTQYFMGIYFQELQEKGGSLVGCVVVQDTPDPSSLHLTAFNFEVDPLLQANGEAYTYPTREQQELTTLNYLCVAAGKTLPARAVFPWNWVGSTQENNDHDGVISINRNTLAQYFHTQLESIVRENCILPRVTATAEGFPIHAEFNYYFTPGQQFTLQRPDEGYVVLSYSYEKSSYDEAGLNGLLGKVWMTYGYTLTVEFVGSPTGDGAEIILTQHQLVTCALEVTSSRSGTGNIVDVKIVDTYTIDVDEDGKLVAALSPSRIDNSYSPRADSFLNFFTGINKLCDEAQAKASTAVSTHFQDVPLSVVKDFVFPGGKTFAFKRANFSEHQDLVSFIQYAAV